MPPLMSLPFSRRSTRVESVIFSNFPLDKRSGTGNPSGTKFQGNNTRQFVPTVATVEISAGAANTTIVWKRNAN